MELSRISSGLPATGAAIQRQQDRFDERAERVVAASLAEDGRVPGEESAGLAGEVVGMRTDAIVNSILFSVFRAQADQAKETADLIRR